MSSPVSMATRVKGRLLAPVQQPPQCGLQFHANGAARASIAERHDIVRTERVGHDRGVAVMRRPNARDRHRNAMPAHVALPSPEQADVG